MIYLVDTECGKMHVFRGERRKLNEQEQNEFTRKRNITAKPIVSKLAYKNMNTRVTKANLTDVVTEFQEM